MVQSIVRFFGLFVSYLLQLFPNPNDPMEDGFTLSNFFFFFFFDLKPNTTPNIFFIEYKFNKSGIIFPWSIY